MAALVLKSLADAEKLGEILAQALAENDYPPLLLNGEPGCGKTALTGMICSHFPGAEAAEVSSPSFTICNIYPTLPPLMHCDLYRCKEEIPEEALDFIDDKAGQIIIEWPQYLEKKPVEFLEIVFGLANGVRELDFRAVGENAQACAKAVTARWRLTLRQ